MSVNERSLEILLTPLRDGITVADTCRRYGVSRQSFYDYRRRLNTEGANALQLRSRRPRTSPRQADPVVEARIVAMRTENPRWGARTIHARLIRYGGNSRLKRAMYLSATPSFIAGVPHSE
ncbi:helix-turn-helix domain-containing protein [Rhodococcus sp. ARC_M6]|uniref:helix-turn-helix domain-containing protein n=1 Tax=Rhodococcus sp. ARC_M6 TaxID=2928852 RepID=UPI001FB39418|nr:helix-turn-helix domain-containing protein [Rhodococcus sp. ARC_M6]MCJ0903118.1 helix-turn-helix domain-containing protein [Rhodococcus sp. ARC_M6]